MLHIKEYKNNIFLYKMVMRENILSLESDTSILKQRLDAVFLDFTQSDTQYLRENIIMQPLDFFSYCHHFVPLYFHQHNYDRKKMALPIPSIKTRICLTSGGWKFTHKINPLESPLSKETLPSPITVGAASHGVIILRH